MSNRAVRTYRFDIIGWGGDPKEIKARWRALADSCREIVNFFWQRWECYHVNQDNDVVLREFNVRYKAWAEAGKTGPAPKLDIKPYTNEQAKDMYHAIRARWPHVASRVVSLLQDGCKKKLSAVSTEGCPTWKAVLLCRQRRPGSERIQPIPFDSDHSKIIPPSGDERNYQLRLTLSIDDTGTIHDYVRLQCRGSGYAIMDRINSGEYEFKGSKITYDGRRNQWCAAIAYRMPKLEAIKAKPGLVAILRPARYRPWELLVCRYDTLTGLSCEAGDDEAAVKKKAAAIRCTGLTVEYVIAGGAFGGDGRHIEYTRRKITREQRSRKANYRNAGSATKGHGRNRATAPMHVCEGKWKRFVKDCNNHTTADVLKILVEKQIGSLILFQPVESRKESRCLNGTGKVDERNDAKAWDWYQVGAMLSQKCGMRSIAFGVKRIGEPKSSGESNGFKKAKRRKGRGDARLAAGRVQAVAN